MKWIAAFLAVAAALLAIVVGSPAMASGRAVGQWRFDEGGGTIAADSSGYGNNGALNGSVSWVPGRFGFALRFAGSPGDVQVPDNPSLDPASGVTVSAWVRDAGTGAYRYIVAKGAAACIAAAYGLYTGPSGGLEFYASRDDGAAYARSPDAGAGVWDGNWHLAVGTFDGTTIRLYVDGAQVGSGTSFPGAIEYPLSSSNDLFIGDYPGCTRHTFVGDIGQVSIWDQALTATQISAMKPGSSPAKTTSGGGSGSGSSSGSGGAGGGGGAGVGGSGYGGGGGSTGSPPGTLSTPRLRLLRLTPSRFTPARSGTGRLRGGSVISYTDTRTARSQFTVLMRRAGIRQGSRCITVTRHRRAHMRRCTGYVTVGSFVHADVAGINRFPFTGRLAGRALAPASYLLSGSASSDRAAGQPVSVSFRIIR